METKTCTKCEETKPLSEFSYRNRSRGTYRADCKSCKCAYNKQYREHNRERLLQQDRDRYTQNKEDILQKNREYRAKNKEKIQQADRDRYYRDRDQKLAQKKEYYISNKDTIRKKQKVHYDANKTDILEQKKEYYQINKNKIKRIARLRYKNDPDYKMRMCIRRRTRDFLKLGVRYTELLGCSQGFLFKWFEYNFKLDAEWGLNWDNFGKVWQIDHVYPLAKASKLCESKQPFYFTWENLRPVPKEYNASKSDKIVPGDIDLIRQRVDHFRSIYVDENAPLYPSILYQGRLIIDDLAFHEEDVIEPCEPDSDEYWLVF